MKALVFCTVLGVFCAAIAVAGSAEGKAVFDKSCKSCHGAEGQGNPTIAKMMKVEMRPLSSAEVQTQSDGDIRNIIGHGKGKMKPVTSVTGKSADDVVAYLRTLKK
jgi:mono/diheme cytochrome c family protein